MDRRGQRGCRRAWGGEAEVIKLRSPDSPISGSFSCEAAEKEIASTFFSRIKVHVRTWTVFSSHVHLCLLIKGVGSQTCVPFQLQMKK